MATADSLLLKRQLACITDTLTNAATRRDRACKGKVTKFAPVATTPVQQSTAQPEPATTMATMMVPAASFDDPKALLAKLNRSSARNSSMIAMAATGAVNLTPQMKNLAATDGKAASRVEKDASKLRLAAATSLTNVKLVTNEAPRAADNAELFSSIIEKNTIPNESAHRTETTPTDHEEVVAKAFCHFFEAADDATRREIQLAAAYIRFLFGDAHGSYAEELERQQTILEAEEKLQAEIKHILSIDKAQSAAEDARRQSMRLIVDNIAADAEVDELVAFFGGFGIKEIRFLEERRHLHRTRTAHVDLCTVQAAKQAVFMIGYIYGLRIHIRRAVTE